MAVGNVKREPEPYDLDDPQEILRLYRECEGYLHTCRRCGGDFAGRRYAREALEELLRRSRPVQPEGAATRPLQNKGGGE